MLIIETQTLNNLCPKPDFRRKTAADVKYVTDDDAEDYRFIHPRTYFISGNMFFSYTEWLLLLVFKTNNFKNLRPTSALRRNSGGGRQIRHTRRSASTGLPNYTPRSLFSELYSFIHRIIFCAAFWNKNPEYTVPDDWFSSRKRGGRHIRHWRGISSTVLANYTSRNLSSHRKCILPCTQCLPLLAFRTKNPEIYVNAAWVSS